MNKTESKVVLGIDLGTTNSCVAIMDGKYPLVLENPNGKRTTPSVVSYDKNKQKPVVGEDAERLSVMNPETIFSVKRSMGTNKTFSLGGKNLTAEQISAEILSYLANYAGEKIGEKVTKVVITVPAYFDDSQRKATENAARIAGLKVERIINEPTAAALAYGLNKGKDQKVLVYDLGGGTFDVSVLQISKLDGQEGIFEVLSTSGINNLGGDDFDKIIKDYVIEEFRKQSGLDLNKIQDEKEKKITLQRILKASQQAKHELSSKLEATVSLPYIASENNKTFHLEVGITRAKFDDLTRSLIKQTEIKIDEAIKDAKLTKDSIEQVILVGGSTRMASVETLIKNKFGEEKINKSVNPDEVVAIGAAIQAAVLTGEIKDVLLLDVTPLSLGIEVEGGLNDRIIQRNTTLPTEEERIYSTAVDNQESVSIKVLQGERLQASGNKELGTFQLNGIEKAPRGVPKIKVKFSIDTNGIVTVTARDEKTNKENSIKITSQSLSEEEIQKMIKEAEENREKDEKFKEELETLNQAQIYYFSLNNQLEEIKKGENFNPEEEGYKKLEEFCNNLKKAIDEREYSEIKKLVEQIQQIIETANKLMEKFPKKEEVNPEEEVLET